MASVKARQTAAGARYDVRYRTPDGSARCKTFRTRRDAEAFARSVEVDKYRGTWVDARDARRSFDDVAREWLRSNPAKRPATIARDELVLDRHVPESFSSTAIGRLRPADVQDLVNEWSAKFKPTTVNRGYGVLRAVFTMAYERDLIGKSPCRGINLPKVERTARPVVSAEDLARLGHELGDDAPIVYLGAVLGLRWGEACGLKVGDLDLLRCRLTVSRTLARDGRGATFWNAPKSSAGQRTLAMPKALADLLSRHLASKGLTAADADAFLFTTTAGTPLAYNNWRCRVWLPALKRATTDRPGVKGCPGLVGVQFHDLRRTNATLLMSSGVDAKTAQSRLGHSDPRLTLAIYAQVVEDADKSAAERLGEGLMPDPRDERAMDAG